MHTTNGKNEQQTHIGKRRNERQRNSQRRIVKTDVVSWVEKTTQNEPQTAPINERP